MCICMLSMQNLLIATVVIHNSNDSCKIHFIWNMTKFSKCWRLLITTIFYCAIMTMMAAAEATNTPMLTVTITDCSCHCQSNNNIKKIFSCANASFTQKMKSSSFDTVASESFTLSNNAAHSCQALTKHIKVYFLKKNPGDILIPKNYTNITVAKRSCIASFCCYKIVKLNTNISTRRISSKYNNTNNIDIDRYKKHKNQRRTKKKNGRQKHTEIWRKVYQINKADKLTYVMNSIYYFCNVPWPVFNHKNHLLQLLTHILSMIGNIMLREQDHNSRVFLWLKDFKIIKLFTNLPILKPTTFCLFLIIQLTAISHLVYCNSDDEVAGVFPDHISNITTTAAFHFQQPNLKHQIDTNSSLIPALSLALGAPSTNINIINVNTTSITTTSAILTSTAALTEQQQHLLPPHIAKSVTTGTVDSSVTAAGPTALVVTGHNILNIINRDNMLKRHNSKMYGVHLNSENTVPSISSNPSYKFISACASCQMREKAKSDNLESIKRHILIRLQLTIPPNITNAIQVPYNILESFYKNYNASVSHVKGYGHIHQHERIKLNTATTPKSHNAHVSGDSSRSLYYDKHDPMAVRFQHQQVPAVVYDERVNDNFNDDSVNINDRMLSDNPHINPTNEAISEDHDDVNLSRNRDDFYDDNNEDFFSHVNSVYVFPTMPRLRLNRKPEILNFKFDSSHSTISHAVMHLYIRGRDWINEHDPKLLEQRLFDGTIEKRREIVISIHRALRRPNAVNFTHTIKLMESRHKIPPGLGQWVQIEVNELSTHWMENRNATQGVVIKSLEPWMRSIIVTGDSEQNKPLTVHIEVMTRENRRQKRSTSLDCHESDHEARCCRYPLKVNFTNFGWHFVVAPTSFDAYFCNGECKVGYLEQYTHTHIASLTTSATPCCSPTKMSPLSLLYFDFDQNLVLSTIPNMSVEKCSCA